MVEFTIHAVEYRKFIAKEKVVMVEKGHPDGVLITMPIHEVMMCQELIWLTDEYEPPFTTVC